MPQDLGKELAVKQQNIDQYVEGTKPPSEKSSSSNRKKADWEYVHPPSGRQYTQRKVGRKRTRKGRGK